MALISFNASSRLEDSAVNDVRNIRSSNSLIRIVSIVALESAMAGVANEMLSR
ncbi:hypothetical protein D3C72_1589380 [compost metagenome]